MPPITIIVPANNEARYIGTCLEALAGQDRDSGPMRVIVSANACTDGTEEAVAALEPEFRARGHELICISSPEPGKIRSINRAERGLPAGSRVYLDADVTCDPPLIGQLRQALDDDRPRYATGTLAVVRAQSAFTRAYARFWQELPFVRDGAVGAGLFAVNPAGRARWQEFPDIISDDTFTRLHFTPDERIETPARYHWPMIEGMARLIRVRRRQDAGVHELRRLFPELLANEQKTPLTPGRLALLALRDPVGFAAYMAVHLAVRGRTSGTEWSRGR